MTDTTGIGVAGCGNVSHMYLPVLARIPDVDVVAVADVDTERAQAVVDKYDLGRAVTPDELLADPAVEIVLNLTPIKFHVEVSKAALAAGKHVYSEKSLATTLAEALDLTADARDRGLALGCAPDTLLGTGFSVGAEALASGAVGRVLSMSAVMLRGAMSRASFYTETSTPFFDMAPYYLSALVTLGGPVTRVSGTTRSLAPGEQPTEPAAGAAIAISGVLDFASGATSDISLVWGSDHRREVAVLNVYGSDGVLAMPNPNNFGDPAFTRRHGEETWTELPGSRQPDSWPHNLRGLGVGEMARAIRAGQAPRAGGDLACHVVEIIAGLVRSAETGHAVEMTTTCTPAPLLPAAERNELLG